MIIDATRLPTDVERGVEGGPMFNTIVVETDGGQAATNQNWEYPLYDGNISYGIQSKTDLRAVQNFFWARRGRARGFLFRDWSDYELLSENLGTGDGTNTDFQVRRNYSDTIIPFVRRVSRPIQSTLELRLDGVVNPTWTLLTGGIVRFSVAPLAGVVVTCSGEFDIPVRFNEDRMVNKMFQPNVGSVPGLTIREVRE